MTNTEVFKIKRRKKKKPALTLAPLIDIIFQLLIFFMLTTVAVENTGIEIKKPRAVSSQLLPRKNIVVTISKESKIYLEGKELSWKEFRKKLKDKITSSPESGVIIVSDIDTKLGTVVDVMDEAKKFGAQRLSIATEHERKAEE